MTLVLYAQVIQDLAWFARVRCPFLTAFFSDWDFHWFYHPFLSIPGMARPTLHPHPCDTFLRCLLLGRVDLCRTGQFQPYLHLCSIYLRWCAFQLCWTPMLGPICLWPTACSSPSLRRLPLPPPDTNLVIGLNLSALHSAVGNSRWFIFLITILKATQAFGGDQ